MTAPASGTLPQGTTSVSIRPLASRLGVRFRHSMSTPEKSSPPCLASAPR